MHPSRSLIICLFLICLCLTSVAADCPVPNLPRPTEDHAVIRARPEAQGLWKTTSDPALSPPDDPQLGDTWLWYVWNLGGFPTADLKPCTVRGVGEHCYVVVDDDEWLVSMDQADVDRIIEHFDETSVGTNPDLGIWDLNTGHFGDPPNPLDGLDRIFLFYYRFNISSDGYFWAFDQYPDGTQSFASNECEVVYLATDSGEPASDYMLAVAAHEFEHLIHYARDENESAWVDEGLGELAMWLFGNPDTISGFNSNPDNSLLSWNSQWADYIKTYLWSLYCYEQYGGQPLIWDLVHNPANGLVGYQQALDGQGHMVSTSDVFEDWSLANYLDDLSLAEGQFGYEGDDLPPFANWLTVDTYPTSGAGSVQSHATDYMRLVDLSTAVTVNIDGSEGAAWRVNFIAIDPVQPTLVIPMVLDAANEGSITLTEAVGYQEVVMAVANVSPSSNGLYFFDIAQGTTSVPEIRVPQVAGHPNPFNPMAELRFSLPVAGSAHLSIHAADGRLVRTLVEEDLPSGEHVRAWNGRDDAGQGVASGIYLVRLQTNRGEARTKITLVR